MKIALPDYHLHTTLCNHASGKMEEYVEKAIDIGLAEIGFSEHMPVMQEPHLCMSYKDLPYYTDSVKKLQDRYSGKINIKLGAEMDIDLEKTDEIENIIKNNEFDYIIGSIHYLDGWPFDQKEYTDRFEKEDVYEIYERFFESVIEAAKSGLYDIVGHIDNIKRFGYRPSADIKNLYEKVALAVREMDLTVEVNTSGYDSPAKEAYPSDSLLTILYENDIPVTVGSDSHCPEHVGRYYDKAYKNLANAGYDSVAFFEKRKRTIKPIKSAK